MFSSSSRYLPPGPRGKPIVGNLFDIPSTEQWIYFKQQADKLGEYSLLWRCPSKTRAEGGWSGPASTPRAPYGR